MKTLMFCIFIAISISNIGCQKNLYDKKALTYKDMFVFNNQFKMDGMYLEHIEKHQY